MNAKQQQLIKESINRNFVVVFSDTHTTITNPYGSSGRWNTTIELWEDGHITFPGTIKGQTKNICFARAYLG